MKHDQLAKTLITAFFADFLALVAPASARRLRLAEASFLDKEFFTDQPTGDRRELDLLARVPEVESGRSLLVHIEIEARARAGMGERLAEYYTHIRQRHRLLVLPILLNLRGGRPGLGSVLLEEGFEAEATRTFRYRVLSLSGCRAAEWLPRPEPLAWAFAALMHPGTWSRAELKVECLRRVGSWEGAESRKDVLINWIESYVQLAGEDAAEYQRLLSQKNNEEVQEMELTWMEKLEARGRKMGLKQGVEKGRAEGLAKGVREGKAQAVEQMRQMVLREIERRFGAVPERVSARVRAIRSLEPLGRMLKDLALVQSADDLLARRRLHES
jgi:hypothetical protein